jgi:hypothetical protein
MQNFHTSQSFTRKVVITQIRVEKGSATEPAEETIPATVFGWKGRPFRFTS